MSGHSPGNATRALALRHRCRHGARIKAANGYFQAGDRFFAGYGRPFAAADRIDESDKLRAQRLCVADRQMPHRVAAIGLKAETLGNLKCQQIADHILVARGDVYVAGFEWSERRWTAC